MVDDIAAATEKMDDESIYKEILVMVTDEMRAGIDELKNPTADFDAIYDVITELYELDEQMYNIGTTYPDGYDAVSSDLEAIETKLDALDEELYSFEVTAARLTEIETEISTIRTEITALEAKAKDAQTKYDEEEAAANAVDYDDLGYEDLVDRAYELEDRFYTAVMDNYEAFTSDDALYALYEDAIESYDEMAEVVNTMIDHVESGDMNAQYVRNARKALQAFDEDVAAIEKALTRIDNTAA